MVRQACLRLRSGLPAPRHNSMVQMELAATCISVATMVVSALLPSPLKLKS